MPPLYTQTHHFHSLQIIPAIDVDVILWL